MPVALTTARAAQRLLAGGDEEAVVGAADRRHPHRTPDGQVERPLVGGEVLAHQLGRRARRVGVRHVEAGQANGSDGWCRPAARASGAARHRRARLSASRTTKGATPRRRSQYAVERPACPAPMTATSTRSISTVA